MVSLVVPAMAVTIFLSSPNKALVKEDLPTLGRPTIAILGKSLPSIAPESSGKCFNQGV
jgi:hypothetical protein